MCSTTVCTTQYPQKPQGWTFKSKLYESSTSHSQLENFHTVVSTGYYDNPRPRSDKSDTRVLAESRIEMYSLSLY